MGDQVGVMAWVSDAPRETVALDEHVDVRGAPRVQVAALLPDTRRSGLTLRRKAGGALPSCYTHSSERS